MSALAVLLVWAALLVPDRAGDLTPAAFLRIPLEGVLLVVLAVVLPPRPARVLALIGGLGIGVLTILRLLDMGFYFAFDRPFHPVYDTAYAGSALGLLGDSIGRVGALVVLVGAGLLSVALLALLPLSAVRLAALVARHLRPSIRTVAVLAAIAVASTLTGIQRESAGQSGLWVDSQRRYDHLVTLDRLTLTDAFGRAGWRTVAGEPANDKDWTVARTYYHYDQVYDRRNLGYAGPRFSYASMPDQYTLAALQRLELDKPDRTPVMAEVDLVSSHTPWAPLPRLVDWNRVGDGSVFDPMPAEGDSPEDVWRDRDRVKAAYAESVAYSLDALTSFVQQLHDRD